MEKTRPEVGDMVMLKGVPPGFVDDLPGSDQIAIGKAVGTAVVLLGYDEDGRGELEFMDEEGVIHTIFVQSDYYDAIVDE